MVIVFKKNNNLVFKGDKIVLDEIELKLAKDRYLKLEKELKKLEEILIKKNLLKINSKRRTNTIYLWYKVGKVIADTFKDIDLKKDYIYTDEFWKSIYDFIPKSFFSQIPKRSKKIGQNHFYLCYLLSKYKWDKVSTIGNWALWRDIFDNKIILSDQRILPWIIKKILFLKKNGINDHKKIRKLFYAVSRRLKNIDTTVLTKEELYKKLNDIEIKIDYKQKTLQINQK